MVAARTHSDWTLPVDVSFGVGEALAAFAEPWSVARMRLEQVLPALMDQARSVQRHAVGLRRAPSRDRTCRPVA